MKLSFLKKDIPFFILTSVFALTFLFLIYSAFQKVDFKANFANGSIMQVPVVVIDAGHGGEDGGAVGVGGIQEKDINLKIAKNLDSMLKASGFKTVMVRDDDYDISDSNLKTVRERKVSDLNNRLKLIESNPNCTFISIHQNKFSQSQYWGTQVFYSPNNDNSKILATDIKDAVTAFLQPENKREIKPADKNIYILYNTKQAAVLVECGFLSNPSEANKLNSDEYQKDMSFAIYSGFLSYWQNLN